MGQFAAWNHVRQSDEYPWTRMSKRMQVALHSSFLSSCITTMKPPLTAIRVTTINITPVHQIVTLLFNSCLDHVPWEIVVFSTSFGMFTQGNRVSHPSPSVLSQPPSCQVVPRDRTRNGSGSDARGTLFSFSSWNDSRDAPWLGFLSCWKNLARSKF